ncbi:MAG: hypothetical protein K8S94_01175 [Planctomycetia bacterium]|nr:hypothetical protein [Planctomycetia bacterium]
MTPPSPGRIIMMIAWLATLPSAAADTLAEKLEPHVGHAIDLIELGTGTRYVRPKLEGVVVRDGDVKSLRIVPEGETRSKPLLLSGITRIDANRETVHTAEVKRGGAAAIKHARAKEAYAKEQAAAAERMQKRGVAPWPRLSAAEHDAELEELRGFAEQVSQAFPALEKAETHEFIMLTDIPTPQIKPYVANLDSMHDFLCTLYGIPPGEPVWKGKCLVVAFLKEEDFQAFEDRFMQSKLRGMHGLCHQRSDGRVIMACHRGDDAPAFAHMLVHETSHGFNYRWLSPTRLPNWLNEGIAEWVGTKLVPGSNQVPLKEAQALEYMQQKGTLGTDFFDAANIESVQYGMASGLVKFLARDLKKFAVFVRAIKEGVPVEESLEQAYGASLDALVKSYGTAIGVPALTR